MGINYFYQLSKKGREVKVINSVPRLIYTKKPPYVGIDYMAFFLLQIPGKSRDFSFYLADLEKIISKNRVRNESL